MRVLVVSCANKSVLYTLTPLAWALRGAGHEVYVASQPEMAEDIANTGMIALPVGGNIHLDEQLSDTDWATDPAKVDGADYWREETPAQRDYTRNDPYREYDTVVSEFLPLVCPDDMLSDLVAFARDWKPDLVLWEELSYTGAVAARASGAAHARVLFGFDAMAQLRTLHRDPLGQRWTDPRPDPLRTWLQPKLDRFGCDFDEEVAMGQWTIDPMPSWLWRPPTRVNYVPVRYGAFHGPTTAEKWLFEKPARKRVCLTLGVTKRESNGVEASAEDLLQAVADLDIEVVATFNDRQLKSVSGVPDNVRIVDFVPLTTLLPTCSAIVHHGSSAAFAAAMEHGVPQLIVPGTYFCECWFGPVSVANGVEDRGAGVFVSNSDSLTPEKLRAQLVRVLEDPSFTENAARLRTELAGAPTPNEIVPALERLTAANRRFHHAP
jgi:glycosyltransferase (activator-dependent family)